MFLFWRIIFLQKVVLLAKVKIPAIKPQNAIDPSDNSPLKMQHGPTISYLQSRIEWFVTI
jgi:hypothetical protein